MARGGRTTNSKAAEAILAKPEARPAPNSMELLSIVRRQTRNPTGKAHVPTDETRAFASTWAEVGASKELIARELGIDHDTLRKHYAVETRGGEERGVANVAAALYERALRGDTAAAIFYLKAKGPRVGWVDRPDDKPSTVVQLDLSKTILQTISALRQGTMPAPMAPARTIDHKPSQDGADLL